MKSHVRRFHINPLAPGKCGCNIKLLIFETISNIDILNISAEIALTEMPQDLTGD